MKLHFRIEERDDDIVYVMSWLLPLPRQGDTIVFGLREWGPEQRVEVQVEEEPHFWPGFNEVIIRLGVGYGPADDSEFEAWVMGAFKATEDAIDSFKKG